MKTLLLASLVVLMSLVVGSCKEGAQTPEASAPAARAAAPAPGPAPCVECGVVSRIETVTAKGESSGAGAIAGAVIGGVIGHQFGGGRGKDLATAAGAVGGAIAGNEIEKSRNASTYYRITVDLESGGTRTVNVTDASALSVGTKVRVVGENLELRS
ncbi:MAG: glycine zipper 2TM domain-containing protein [Gammaproteobacteria bacterium]